MMPRMISLNDCCDLCGRVAGCCCCDCCCACCCDGASAIKGAIKGASCCCCGVGPWLGWLVPWVGPPAMSRFMRKGCPPASATEEASFGCSLRNFGCSSAHCAAWSMCAHFIASFFIMLGCCPGGSPPRFLSRCGCSSAHSMASCCGSALMSSLRTASFHSALCSPAAGGDQRAWSPLWSAGDAESTAVAVEGCCMVPRGSVNPGAWLAAPGAAEAGSRARPGAASERSRTAWTWAWTCAACCCCACISLSCLRTGLRLAGPLPSAEWLMMRLSSSNSEAPGAPCLEPSPSCSPSCSPTIFLSSVHSDCCS